MRPQHTVQHSPNNSCRISMPIGLCPLQTALSCSLLPKATRKLKSPPTYSTASPNNSCRISMAYGLCPLQTALKLGSGPVHEFHQLLTACLREDRPAGEAARQACYVFLLLTHVKSPEQQTGYRQACNLRPDHVGHLSSRVFLSSLLVCHAMVAWQSACIVSRSHGQLT